MGLWLRRVFRAAAFLLLLAFWAGAANLTGALIVDNPAAAQVEGKPPGSSLGSTSDSDLWRTLRRGFQGTVSFTDKQKGVAIQSEGDNWRAVRNGPLSVYGGWLMLATIVILAVFFAVRGRIRVEAGLSGRTVERFNTLERFTHWLTASSFIVLALTGLNVLYGKYVLMPIIGQDTFAALTYLGKLAHNYIAFAFMIGLVLMVILWVKDNLPSREDLTWIAKGGGMFAKGVHPPAKKFNFGQKAIFWVVVLGGTSLAYTGLSLMFFFDLKVFSASFALLNLFGFDLPTQLTVLQESQLAQLWHAVLALIVTAVIIAHIYIGSLGMEGAFDAVSTGQVDENWAREHHSLWIADVKGEAPPSAPMERPPAE
ncbi:MAG: formate dehydrogenase subunit gamma [Proteobacteria bacterium]|nr:formate dehydrogenase subunit gamma [Pseudomonadota bacterium]